MKENRRKSKAKKLWTIILVLFVLGVIGSLFPSENESNDSSNIEAPHQVETESARFLNKVSPAYAFISVGKDNSYGHPTKRVMKSLKKRSIKMFRTDLQGTVTAFSDGKDWTFDTEPCQDWSAGGSTTENATAPAAAKRTTGSSVAATYVLNIHTMKFHYPDCSSVSRMNYENKQTVSASREELIKQRYDPCGNCHP